MILTVVSQDVMEQSTSDHSDANTARNHKKKILSTSGPAKPPGTGKKSAGPSNVSREMADASNRARSSKAGHRVASTSNKGTSYGSCTSNSN